MEEGLLEAIGREPALRVKAAVLLAIGATQRKAGEVCGVASRTIRRWLKESNFRRLVDELTVMRQAAMGVWKERPSWAGPEAGTTTRKLDGPCETNGGLHEGGGVSGRLGL